jgi:hypothetical protein
MPRGQPWMLMKKKTGQDFWILTSIFSVALPGIEPAALPGKMRPELTVRYVWFPFGPVRYPRGSFRVLTASRGSHHPSSPCRERLLCGWC